MSDWDSPADSEFFTIKDHVGSLCIFAINEFIPQFPTSMGVRDTVKAEIVVIDGPNNGKRYAEGLLFGAKLVPQVKGKVGGNPVLGRIVTGQAKAGQSAPYLITDPTDDDKKIANEWVKANGPVVSVPTHTARPAPQPQPNQNPGQGGGDNWRMNQNQGQGGYPNQGPPPNPWGAPANNQHSNSYVNSGGEPPY